MAQTQTRFTKQELANAAQEMINILELENDDESSIQVDEKSPNQSREQIFEFWRLVEKGDSFTQATAETLQKLGFNPEVSEQQQSQSLGEGKKVVDEARQEAKSEASKSGKQEKKSESQKQEKEKQESTESKKKSGEEEKSEKSGKGQKEQETTGKEKSVQSSKQGKSKGPPKIGRAKVLADILYENVTKSVNIDDIISQMQNKYGGTIKESEKFTKSFLAVLYNLSHISWDDEGNVKYKG